MIGLDTNVLLRYLLQDDEVQGQKASRAISQAVARRESLFISVVALCEAVWVLESAYKQRKAEIVSVLDGLLETSGFEIEDRDLVRAAVDDYRSHKADFADCWIGRTGEAQQCRYTLTFERSLKTLEMFRVL
jgi:predicted nucleic-acid-binding protein